MPIDAALNFLLELFRFLLMSRFTVFKKNYQKMKELREKYFIDILLNISFDRAI